MTGGTEVLTGADPDGGPVAAAPPGGDAETEATDAPPRRGRTPLVVLGLTAVLAVPLVVTLVALSGPHWYPLLDLAQTEMRVRDVGTGQSPLVGLIGRIEAYGRSGSHPGPLSFWSLAPTYRVFGSSAFGLLAGVVVLNITAIGLALWVAVRQGGARLALVVAAVVAVLLHVYGTNTLTEPWNPYMPVLWWFLAVLALWAVLCDDLAMLPVAVYAASFCMQTHVSYLGLVGGLVALAVAAFVVRLVRVRRDREARRRLLGWTAVAVVLGFVLWLPPLIDQIANEPGNALIVARNFSEPDTDPIGVRRAVEIFGTHLDPWRFLSVDDRVRTGSSLPAAALVAVWLACAGLTLWGRRRQAADDPRGPQRARLLRLHALVGVVLVLGLVTVSRIFGDVWYYLTLWAWAVTALVLVAVAWSIMLALPRGSTAPARWLGAGAVAALVAVLVAWTAQFTVDGSRAEVASQSLTDVVGDLADPTEDALAAGDLPGTGPDARYLMTWTDPNDLGAAGWGLLGELERRGYDVGVPEIHRVGAPHRVLPAADADAEVHVSVGPDIEVWEGRPEAERIAYTDVRTDAERAEYERLRAQLIEDLEAAGHTDLVPWVDINPFGLYYEARVDDETRERVFAMLSLGLPVAVFVGPPPAA
jgi:hypothetical protein